MGTLSLERQEGRSQDGKHRADTDGAEPLCPQILTGVTAGHAGSGQGHRGAGWAVGWALSPRVCVGRVSLEQPGVTFPSHNGGIYGANAFPARPGTPRAASPHFWGNNRHVLRGPLGTGGGKLRTAFFPRKTFFFFSPPSF